MPDLDEKVYLLDTRVSTVEKELSLLSSDQEHMGRTVLAHMKQEEKDREIMESKLDGLMRYKWILFGAVVMMWLLSGENQILQLIKAVH